MREAAEEDRRARAVAVLGLLDDHRRRRPPESIVSTVTAPSAGTSSSHAGAPRIPRPAFAPPTMRVPPAGRRPRRTGPSGNPAGISRRIGGVWTIDSRRRPHHVATDTAARPADVPAAGRRPTPPARRCPSAPTAGQAARTRRCGSSASARCGRDAQPRGAGDDAGRRQHRREPDSRRRVGDRPGVDWSADVARCSCRAGSSRDRCAPPATRVTNKRYQSSCATARPDGASSTAASRATAAAAASRYAGARLRGAVARSMAALARAGFGFQVGVSAASRAATQAFSGCMSISGLVLLLERVLGPPQQGARPTTAGSRRRPRSRRS